MSKKNVDDYLTEGMYGTRLPKDDERRKYLGTLRERIILALTVGQVMTDSGIEQLAEAMKQHPESKLLINGKVSYRFMSAEIKVANEHNISYTIVADESNEAGVGAVLTYDYAINKEEIFIQDIEENDEHDKEEKDEVSFLDKLKGLFRSK